LAKAGAKMLLLSFSSAVGSPLVQLPSASIGIDKAWAGKAWALSNADDPMSPIQMDVSEFTRAKQAVGSTAHQWHPTTNMKPRGAASYTSVCLERGDAREASCGIMYSQRKMRHHEMPKHDDQVMIYMPNKESLGGLSLEKEEEEGGGENEEEEVLGNDEEGETEGSRTITLVPVMQEAVPAARQRMDEDEESKPRSSFSVFMKARRSLYESSAVSSPSKFERKLLPYPFVWGLWAPYLAAGFYPAFYTAAAATTNALAPSMEADLAASRKLAQKEHASPLYIALKGKRISFRDAGELERKMFLPFFAAPLFFYPWGFAIGAAFYAAPLVGPALTAPLLKPFKPEVWKNITDAYIAWYKMYWTSYLWWGGLGYWYWFWVVYTTYWQPMIAKYWFGVYTAYWDFWSKFWPKPTPPPMPPALMNATVPTTLPIATPTPAPLNVTAPSL